MLIYSGPLLPAIGLYYSRSIARVFPFKKTVIILFVLHFVAFIPFGVGAIRRSPDFVHLMLFPALTGSLSLLISIILLIIALVRIKKLKSEQSA